MNVEQYKEQIRGRKISVIGLGVSNVPLIKFLLSAGAEVTAHDRKSREQLGEIYTELSGVGVKFVLGDNYLTCIPDGTSLIFKTPGLRIDVPELVCAAERGIEITSEMELFFELCPCKIIAVTGSDGKTTTTTLIGEMLAKQGFRCHIGGNIGKPLIGEVEEIKPEDMAVLELSSFQLHTMKKSPDIAVITNVTPNHLDWHKDFAEYTDAKKNIFRNQVHGGRVVLNYDNEITRGFAAETENYMFFSRKSELERGIFLRDDTLVLKTDCADEREILNINDIKIPGMHNVENYMAAIAAVYEYVSQKNIVCVARSFGGVQHRIELVRELDGVRYYNDSIASSPARTTAGLRSFKQKVILIAGGYDKKIPFDSFGAVVNEHVKKLVLIGKTSDKIESAVKNAENYCGLPIYRENDFEAAVNRARECAERGDIVILSPACASFDLFKNFEERGNAFKSIVMSF